MMLAGTPRVEPLASLAALPPVSGEVAHAGARAREFLTAVRAELHARHDAGTGGLALVAAYTDAIDHLVRLLFADASVHYMSRNARINQRCASPSRPMALFASPNCTIAPRSCSS